MAQAVNLSFTWRDNTVRTRVLTAFALAYGYQQNIPDPDNPGQTIPNPVTALQFFERQLLRHIRDVVAGQEAQAAGTTSATTKKAEVETDLDINA